MGGPPGGVDDLRRDTGPDIPDDLRWAPGVTPDTKEKAKEAKDAKDGVATDETKKKVKKVKKAKDGVATDESKKGVSTGPVDPKSQVGELINALGDIFGNDTPFGKAVRVRLEKVLGQPLSPAKAMSGGSDSHRRVKYGTRALSLLESTGRCSLSPDELEQFQRYYRKIRHA